MNEPKHFQVYTGVVFSKDGGTISYDKETTIKRALVDLEGRLRNGIPDDMLCSLITGEINEDVTVALPHVH